MVISYKMNESEMGYRGSKSEINKKKVKMLLPNIHNKRLISVKEQRVDGS